MLPKGHHTTHPALTPTTTAAQTKTPTKRSPPPPLPPTPAKHRDYRTFSNAHAPPARAQFQIIRPTVRPIPSQALLVLWLEQTDHVAVRAPYRRHRSVRRVLDRPIQVTAHLERSLDGVVHVRYIEAQQRGVPAAGRGAGSGRGVDLVKTM